MQKLKEMSIDIGTDDKAKQRDMMVKCAMTSMNSKLVSARFCCSLCPLLSSSLARLPSQSQAQVRCCIRQRTADFDRVLMQVSAEKEFFANLVVDAVSVLDPQTLDLRMIGIKKVRWSYCFTQTLDLRMIGIQTVACAIWLADGRGGLVGQIAA